MTDPQEEPKPESWAYAGQRLTSTGKLVDEWYAVDTDGEPVGDSMWYASKRGRTYAVGSIYTAQVSRSAGNVRLHGQPDYTSGRVDDEHRTAWAAAHHTARVVAAKARNEANAAKADALNEALEPLLVLARKARTGVERDALIATVVRRLAQA